jgi:oxygen-independent coproporphyrinogen-3 oxidase
MSLGLYLHVPFCASICNYCNFNRGLFDPALKLQYVEALEQEILRAGDGAGADTIFFGGGTPSLLESFEIRRLIEACRGVFDVARDAEVTLEANPETVDAARLASYREAGVTRLSLGVQSLRDDELTRLGRLHGRERARASVADARVAGFDNVSIDLMMWLPQQTMREWHSTLEAAIELAPDHLSLYLLELYPNAPLREVMARSRWSLAAEDEAAEMYLTGLERLDAAGYEQYEISNVARPGRRSRHNLKYWQDGAWLGFGCGAHSTRGGRRWKNVASTEEYISRVAPDVDLSGQLPMSLVAEGRDLASAERFQEAIFTGLRLNRGIDTEKLSARYGVDFWAEYDRPLQPFLDQGVLLREGSRLRLSREGMLLANEVLQVFV